MTNIATKTCQVAVIKHALAYYEVEAESPRDAAENWSDGEFYDRDDEALETEGPAIVRERQPDATWRKVPRYEWEDETPPAGTAPAPDAVAHTPGDWTMNIGWTRAVVYDDHATIGKVPIDLVAWEANAALIKAAPKLLAACRMVVERWERGDLAEAARACGAAIADAVTVAPPPAIDPAKKPYSVLLLYPDYADDDGTETYYAFVDAPDPVAAVAAARQQALAAQEGVIFPSDDFAPLLVTEGHHYGQPMTND